jgi:Zn-dependent protease
MNFLGGSLRIGRLFDINIRVHVLFLVYIGFRVYEAVQGGGTWQGEVYRLAMLFGIVFVHELGHCFGARSVGGDAHDILMWPLGGLAYAHAPMRPWPQFVTVACGPLVNVIFCVLSALVAEVVTGWQMGLPLNPLSGHFEYHGTTPPPAWLMYVLIFYDVNLFILAFNLLPVFPLDGGQLFQALIWPFVGLQRATMIACQVGLLGCVLFGLYGLSSHGASMLIFIALFGGMTCWQRLQAARAGWVVEDPTYARYDTGPRGGRFWSRLFGSRRRATAPVAPVESPNPNPGGWETKMTERDQQNAELDRILKKVAAHGIHSLSYVERQTLEHITRERQREENEYQRENRV